MNAPTSSPKALLLSLRPRYAELILAGDKTIELRKQRPRVPPGTLVVMYASQPVCAIVGTFVLRDIVAEAPEALWAKHGAQSGITKALFDQYYAGHDRGFGLLINDARPLSSEVSLAVLRERWHGFHPPQSYRYIHPTRTAQSVRLQAHDTVTHVSL